MFDSNGDFINDHDLEAGAWDGHSYDCPAPIALCDCDPAAGLAWLSHEEADEDQDEQDEIAADYACYLGGR